jgi:hypothetical protein
VLVRAFHRVVLARRWLCFLVMCLSFALFGAGTLNLFNFLKANLRLIADNGLMALADGAAQQLAELLATLASSMLSYLVFKACEVRLVQGLLHPPQKDTHP